MALEKKEVYVDGSFGFIRRCYEVKEEYEMFCWKFVEKEDCVDENGRYCYLHFTRDKDAPWYKRVCELEKEYEDIRKNNYEEIKSKYNYEARAKIGEKPQEYILPELAEPSKFFKSTVIFIIGILMLLIGLAQSGEVQKILPPIGGVVLGIGAIILLCKLKYLKGLKGEEKKKALERYSKYQEDKKQYDDKVSRFFEIRKNEIEEELSNIRKTI